MHVTSSFAARDLVSPLEPRALPQYGWWTLNTRAPDGALKQRSYKLDEMAEILQGCRNQCDTYMSQSFFTRPSRLTIDLAYVTHSYVDLDTYKCPGLEGLSQEQVVGHLLYACRDDALPYPSVIISSGRGLNIKYYWTHPIPRAAAGRAIAVNRALVKLFARFGADPQAVDLSRILRVVGTVNAKAGTITRILWLNDREPSYDFDLFADDVLPFSLEQVRRFRAEATERRASQPLLSRRRAAEPVQKSGGKAICWDTWHWAVLEDLRRLAERRYPDGIVPPGARDIFGFVGALQLAHVIPAARLWPEILAWAQTILPPGYIADDLESHCTTLLRRVRDAAANRKSAPGRAPVYTPSKEWYIQALAITGAEMTHLCCLIDGEEKKLRDRLAWRASHSGQSRAEYEAAAKARTPKILVLLQQGRSYRSIAAELGISAAEVHRLAKAARAEQDDGTP